jgi:aryl-alcohol dehydrogenase-like predicted oxidoreductase
VRYRPLGRTGLTVSALSLGTVALGIDYGIHTPGAYGRPDDDAAVALLREAVDRGVMFVDTSPFYGESERLVGQALGGDRRATIATKVWAGPGMASGTEHLTLPQAIAASLEASRRVLRRDVLDVVQIRNATRAIIEEGVATAELQEAKARGILRFIGATVYDEDAALAVIRDGRFDLVQIALNALDQRMLPNVMPAAAAAGIGVIVRSAFLKGVLTPKAQWLPEPLAPLRAAAVRARDFLAGGSWDRLPEAAMRFCLSIPHVASVLTGARTLGELDEAMAAEASGPFDPSTLASAAQLALTDDRLLNPASWGLQ